MMSPVINHKLLLCSLIALVWSGCTYGPTPYGGGYGATPYYGGYPNGPGYQGGYQNYQMPTQTLQPGQQYIPGGTVTPQGVYPGGTPTYQNNGGLVPIPSNGASTDAPPYSSSAEINKPVPPPSQPTGGPFYNNSNTSTFQPPINAQEIHPATHEQEPLQPINSLLRESHASTMVTGPNENYSPPPAAPMNNAIDINSSEIPSLAPIESLPPANSFPSAQGGNDPFSSPVPAPASNNSTPPAMPIFDNISTNKLVSSETKVFSHDSGYRWLRGVVSQDKPTGTWSVVYSDNPQESDKYAGHLSLASSPYLKGLQDGAIVELQGDVDPVLKDPLGKPFYLVSNLLMITEAPKQ